MRNSSRRPAPERTHRRLEDRHLTVTVAGDGDRSSAEVAGQARLGRAMTTLRDLEAGRDHTTGVAIDADGGPERDGPGRGPVDAPHDGRRATRGRDVELLAADEERVAGVGRAAP